MSYRKLFQKAYDLAKWVYPTVNTFPRKQRLVLSQRIEVTTIRILELIIDLSERDTKTNRRKILYEVHKLQLLLRLCKDLSYLTFKKYEHVSSLLSEISDLLDHVGGGAAVEACGNLYADLCSFRNLELAFRNARKGKRHKKAVQDFEFNLEENLLVLKRELETLSYSPRPLRQFPIRDPKTRLISASHFRDRVMHHALINVIQPLFEKRFIHDSCANQVGKGTTKALERFEKFKKKVSKNGRPINHTKDNSMIIGYVLKADIKHYFDTIDHQILLDSIRRKLKDKKVLWLIQKILDNHASKRPGKGMPIGNLTSQFFANLYLSELDHFVKHELKVKCYIRYVDDFVLLDRRKEGLEECKEKISIFLKSLRLELHPDKSKVYPLHTGLPFLGFRMFYYHRLLKKSNIRKMEKRIPEFLSALKINEMSHEDVTRSFDSWVGYAKQGNTFNFRKRMERKVNNILKIDSF